LTGKQKATCRVSPTKSAAYLLLLLISAELSMQLHYGTSGCFQLLQNLATLRTSFKWLELIY